MLLVRQAWPGRLWVQRRLFGRSPTTLSIVYNDVTSHLLERYEGMLLWHPRLDNYDRLVEFAEATGLRTGLMGQSIWGFIDGTFRPFCRPSVNQGYHYSGQKKRHGLKFQGIATPDGLMSSMSGPWLARFNDWRIYLDSGVPQRMANASPPPTNIELLLTSIYRSTRDAVHSTCTAIPLTTSRWG